MLTTQAVFTTRREWRTGGDNKPRRWWTGRLQASGRPAFCAGRCVLGLWPFWARMGTGTMLERWHYWDALQYWHRDNTEQDHSGQFHGAFLSSLQMMTFSFTALGWWLLPRPCPMLPWRWSWWFLKMPSRLKSFMAWSRWCTHFGRKWKTIIQSNYSSEEIF